MTDEDCATYQKEHGQLEEELREAANKVCRAAWKAGWISKPNVEGAEAHVVGQAPPAVMQASEVWAELLVRQFDLERAHLNCFPQSIFKDLIKETQAES